MGDESSDIEASDDRPRLLFVDDEPNVLHGIRKGLRRRREWEAAFESDPEAALDRLENQSYAVIVSDMRMPGMNGAEFLRRARRLVPDSVRILLTGHTDLDAAMAAVNEGYIFRFLNKPCPPPVLKQALEDALDQYRMVTGDRRLLETRLAQLSRQLLRAERLASLGTLASGVGHELGNMAQVFSGALEMVRDSHRRGELADVEDLDALTRVAQHLALHSRHLLNLGRPSGLEEDDVDLAVFVGAVTDMLRMVGRTKYITLRVQPLNGPTVVRVNQTRLEQVLMNLVSNASYATAETPARPGVVDISIAREESAGMARIDVADNGIGIPADRLATIFEPYYTTKPRGEGTGLGLPVVKEIVESFGGSVAVVSQHDVGTTFTVRLPLVRPLDG